MKPIYRIHIGNSRLVLAEYPDNHFDSVVCDPPYALESVVKRFGGPNAEPAQFGKDGAFSRQSKGFMGQCYHPGTDILTRDGWKNICDATTSDEVATLNLDGLTIEWQPVKKTHRYEFNGELLHIRHRSAEQLVTPNHNVVASNDGGDTFRLMRPAGLKRAFHLISQGAYTEGNKSDIITLSVMRPYGKDWVPTQETKSYPAKPLMRFLGFFLGDGFTVSRKDDHPANDFFGVSVKKPRKINFIREVLSALAVKFTETPKPGGSTTFYCYDFVLLYALKPLGGARDKFIPSWALQRSPDQLEELYLGLMESDGNRTASRQETYTTSSRALVDDLQRLCLYTGRSAAFHWREPSEKIIKGNTVRSSGSWTACILQNGKRLYAECKGRRGNPDAVVPFSYSGEVFCVEVERHHTLYTRFNGKPVWSGNSWDTGETAFDPEFWIEVMRVMKPGAHLLAFSGSRTYHKLTMAIETAGFEIRDRIRFEESLDTKYGAFIDGLSLEQRGVLLELLNDVTDGGPELSWHYGSGFPKSHDVGDGWGTALKPAHEPIVFARKIFKGTVAGNVKAWGVGAINIEGCRVEPTGESRERVNEPSADRRYNDIGGTNFAAKPGVRGGSPDGRFPANVIHDGSDEVRAAFPHTKSGTGAVKKASAKGGAQSNSIGAESRPVGTEMVSYGDEGSAARFFYCAKASRSDRGEDNNHPTVKPTDLMRYLCRLVTPPNGTVLDPFMGSGSTGKGALLEGFNFVGIELSADYARIAEQRLAPLAAPSVEDLFEL